jgi:hypothetical protein
LIFNQVQIFRIIFELLQLSDLLTLGLQPTQQFPTVAGISKNFATEVNNILVVQKHPICTVRVYFFVILEVLHPGYCLFSQQQKFDSIPKMRAV